jgi:hypothetical protein
VGNGPSSIKIARRKNTRAQKHANGFPGEVAHVDLEIEIHALTVVAAVLIVVDVSAKRDVLAVWNPIGISTRSERLQSWRALGGWNYRQRGPRRLFGSRNFLMALSRITMALGQKSSGKSVGRLGIRISFGAEGRNPPPRSSVAGAGAPVIVAQCYRPYGLGEFRAR